MHAIALSVPEPPAEGPVRTLHGHRYQNQRRTEVDGGQRTRQRDESQGYVMARGRERERARARAVRGPGSPIQVRPERILAHPSRMCLGAKISLRLAPRGRTKLRVGELKRAQAGAADKLSPSLGTRGLLAACFPGDDATQGRRATPSRSPPGGRRGRRRQGRRAGLDMLIPGDRDCRASHWLYSWPRWFRGLWGVWAARLRSHARVPRSYKASCEDHIGVTSTPFLPARPPQTSFRSRRTASRTCRK